MKISLYFAALLLLSTGAAFAQAQPAAPDSVRPAAIRAHRNVLRLDVLVLPARALSSMFDEGEARPVLLAYERQLGPHLSANVEALLDGGTLKESRTGLALQMRYYLASPRHPTGITGFYVAPTLSTRIIKRDYIASSGSYTSPSYRQRRVLGGAGILVGRQAAFGLRGRLLFDASLGIMGWQRLNDSPDMSAGCAGCTDEPTDYEQNIFMPDLRLGLGYRF